MCHTYHFQTFPRCTAPTLPLLACRTFKFRASSDLAFNFRSNSEIFMSFTGVEKGVSGMDLYVNMDHGWFYVGAVVYGTSHTISFLGR